MMRSVRRAKRSTPDMTALRKSAADGLDIESTIHAEAMRRSADDDDSSDDVDDDSMRMAQMNTKPTLTARMIPILKTRGTMVQRAAVSETGTLTAMKKANPGSSHTYNV